MKTTVTTGLAVVVVSLGFAAQADATVISADFGPDITSPHDFSGVEAVAAAADSRFAVANVWNHLRVPDFFSAAVTNPSFAGLVDSSGNLTSTTFSVTGDLKGFDFIAFYGAAPPDTLRHDMFFFNSFNNRATSIDWSLTGLTPNTAYSFYVYGTRADQARVFDLFVDINGNGSLADDTPVQIGSGSYNMQTAIDGFFPTVVSSASGTIIGRGIGLNGEANWSGFQIASIDPVVPEPASLALWSMFGLGVIGRGLWRRRQE